MQETVDLFSQASEVESYSCTEINRRWVSRGSSVVKKVTNCLHIRDLKYVFIQRDFAKSFYVGFQQNSGQYVKHVEDYSQGEKWIQAQILSSSSSSVEHLVCDYFITDDQ